MEGLAGRLNVSTRLLTRLFREELGTTPARYVESIRFDIAKSLLDQGHTATQAAAMTGFPSYESLRRVFGRELSISPAAYQRRFATARREPAGQPPRLRSSSARLPSRSAPLDGHPGTLISRPEKRS